MLQAAEGLPVNLGFLGKGNGSLPGPLEEQIRAGACGLKLHEDWGTTPAAIDCCLGVADQLRRAGRHPHRHAQRVGLRRGHHRRHRGPDDPHLPHRGGRRRPRPGHHHDRRACRNVLPSSTNPTRPFTVNTHRRAPRHADGLPPPVARRCRRTWPSPRAASAAETIAAEDILHDRGILSMFSSDSQAMGRIGEVILRSWQTAHKMKVQFGAAAGRHGSQRQHPGQALRRQVHDQPGDHARHRRPRRQRRAGQVWPTWCCGSRPSSA